MLSADLWASNTYMSAKAPTADNQWHKGASRDGLISRREDARRLTDDTRCDGAIHNGARQRLRARDVAYALRRTTFARGGASEYQGDVAEVNWLACSRVAMVSVVHSDAQNVRGSAQDVLKCATC